MEEYRLLCEPLSWCTPFWSWIIAVLFIGLPTLPWILAIMLGPTPEQQERHRQALAAACYHCRHTRTPCAHRAKPEEEPLC